jgi:hypothetical protein
MKSGVKPCIPSRRDKSFHATFGTVSVFPDTYNSDSGFTMPDQNADGYPDACTGYTQSELCADEDKTFYDPIYTYNETLLIENEPTGQPCDLRDSLKTTIVYGVQKKDANDAYTHRRGDFYRVDDAQNGTDAFDKTRSAMIKYSNLWGKSCSVSVASRWCDNFENIQNGIIPIPDLSNYSLHNWKVCGWKSINGIPYLIGKSWQGTNYGDNGWAYFSREIYNTLLKDYFAAAYVLAPYTGDAMTVKLTALEVIVEMFAKAGFTGDTIGRLTLLIEKVLFGKI